MRVPLDTPAVTDAVARAADPARAEAGLTRVVDAHPDIADRLAAGGDLLEAVVAVATASNSLLAGIVADAHALRALDDAASAGEATPESLSRAWIDYRERDDDAKSALRRWKRAQIVRIAARDLLGRTDLRTVGRELAALADTCLRAALDTAAPSTAMAVIGMGKLGGRELNYASDVDVLFVHEGDAAEADRAARLLLTTMTARTADGVVFRTDADLRPEGRAGSLSRSLDSFVAYWERWAQTWEFQALMKARPVAGDADLGRAFVERAAGFVWPETLDPDSVREVRAMKARSEDIVAARDLEGRELKRGRGGIRDIEFAVQLLQLVHGRHDPSIRSPTTLDALARLAVGGYVSESAAERLEEAYVWLRTVEHRLQLVDEQQTHTLPADPDARTLLARGLGFRDRGGESALEAFDAAHQERLATVRVLHEKLFFAPLLDTLAGAGALPPAAAEERLAAFGFRDVEHTRAALQELTAGLTRSSRVMQQLLPVLLAWLSAAPDPDLGLLQLRRLTEGYTRSSTLARRFRETPIAAERTCRLLGSSRVVGDALHRQPDFVDALADDAFLAAERSPGQLAVEALDSLNWRETEEGRHSGLRRFKRRHLLRVATRDLLEFAPVETVGRELAALADACVEAALRSLEATVPFAVIGMGRLGGRELSYASDIDVLFVYDGDGHAAFDAAEKVALRLMRAIGQTTAEGQTFRIDADLRPEGKAGPLARSLDGYASYYGRWAQTWEFQSLLRARPVAGDADLAERFLALVAPFVYREPFPDDGVREVRRMKARIERERIPPGEDPQFHLKLGRGTLSDVEFAVQLLQLQHGAAHADVRSTSTLGALHELDALGAIDEADAEALAASYRLCERARNARYLLTGVPGDSLPVDTEEGRRLARLLGFAHRPQATLRDEYRRVTRRARAVFERVFFGRE